jgi:hypothetical protein
VPTGRLPNDSDDGETTSAGPPVPPPAYTSNSDSCAAGQPVFAVNVSLTYRRVPAGRLMVTLFPDAGLNVYPVEPTIVPNDDPSVEPSTLSVWVRVCHAAGGGNFSTTRPTD